MASHISQWAERFRANPRAFSRSRKAGSSLTDRFAFSLIAATSWANLTTSYHPWAIASPDPAGEGLKCPDAGTAPSRDGGAAAHPEGVVALVDEVVDWEPARSGAGTEDWDRAHPGVEVDPWGLR